MSEKKVIPESQRKAVNKYTKNHYDRISAFVPKGDKERWANVAKRQGFKGLNGYIRACVEYCIKNSVKFDNSTK